MDKIRIFVLGTRGFPDVQGGVEKHCEELYPRVAKLGSEITVFARRHYFLNKKKLPSWNGVRFIYLWSPRKKGIEAFIHTFIASIISIFKKPDIMHFHNIGPSIFIPLAKLFRIKTVLTYHSINYLHQKWSKLEKLLLRFAEMVGLKFADKVIVISKTTKEFLEKKYKRHDLIVIPNGVNLPEILLGGDTLKKYNLEEKKYVYTTCRFVPEKGLHDLILSYRKIKNPEFKLVIAGDADHETEYSRNLKKLAKETEGVVLTGVISGELLQELYSNAGLFVLPSYYEGLPIALLEAMSYGLPVLVSGIPQNREISLPEFRFFKAGDIDALAKKMVKLLKIGIDEEEKIKQMKILKENYNWDKIVEKTYQVYKSVLNKHQNGYQRNA